MTSCLAFHENEVEKGTDGKEDGGNDCKGEDEGAQYNRQCKPQ